MGTLLATTNVERLVKSPTVQSLTDYVTQMISERIATRELRPWPHQPLQCACENSMGTTLASIHDDIFCLATPNATRRAAAKRS